MKKQPTPEQLSQFKSGCSYEFFRWVSILLMVGIITLAVPLLEPSIAQSIVLVCNAVGMVMVAYFISLIIFPDSPLVKLAKELEEKDDLP